MWPPSGSPARSAGSTLTRSPAASPPSVVRPSVSATTSNAKRLPSCSTTVRQTPSIAIESPSAASVSGASTTRREPSKAATLPSSRTMPVNTQGRLRDADVRFEQHVFARRPGGKVRERHRFGQLAEEVRPSARDDRRDEDEQFVDEPRPKERGRECRPALEQKRLHALVRERAQLLAERAASHLELRRTVTEREPPRLTNCVDITRIKPWIVGPHRAHADRDRLRRRAQQVNV